MSILSDKGKQTLHSFADWVSADSPDIPQEVIYPPKKDDHGHGEEVAEEAVEETATAPSVMPEETPTVQTAPVNEMPVIQEAFVTDEASAEPETLAPDELLETLLLEEPAAVKPAPPTPPMSERRFVLAMGDVYRGVSLVGGILLAIILLATVAALPKFGSAENPALNEVSKRYVEEGIADTGAANAVAGMILDYRAFDTLGESIVLFTATVTVLFLLQQQKRRREDGGTETEDYNLRGVRSLPAKIVISISFPFILLYGVYVVLNGHLSPGGGFSGGTIMGGALILAHVAFGDIYMGQFVTIRRCIFVVAGALTGYIAIKSYSILTGANEIAGAIPLGTPGSIFSAGLILPLNICIGLIVACTMYTLYSLFTGWKA